MPIWTGARGVGGGRGGFSLGPAQNTFGTTTTTNQAAAETLRNTYATANAAWLALYSGDRSLWIQLIWTGNASVIQRRNAAGTAWEDITGIIRGRTGPQGGGGTDAVGSVLAFLESATVPAAPTVTQDASNVLTFTDSWSLDYPAAPTNAVYSIAVRHTLDGTVRTIPAGNVEGPFKVTGSDGAAGLPGTPRTGPEVVTLLQALAGDNRLNATALRLLAGALDAELGQDTWRTGGAAQTAAQILALLLTVDGPGSGIDADLLDGMTPAEVAALSGGSDTAAQILAKLLTVDGAGSALDADLLDGMTPAEVAALGGGGGGLTQAQVDARITNRIAPRVFVATAGFTQLLSIISFSVTPTTTDAPAIGDVVMVRTPDTVAASTGVALAMAIDGIGGSATYILDRSDGLGLNAAELAPRSIYMTVFDGTNFEIVGQPLSPRVALTTGAVFTGITEGVDPTTAQGFVTRAHLDLQTPTYTASASSWDEASQTITLTLPVGSVVPGDEIIFLVPPVLTGQDDTGVQISVGGRTGTLRTFQSFTTLVLSRELVPREILLVQASGGDTYRMLEPHIVQRTGVWDSGRLYVLGQESTLNGFDYKLLTETSTNENPETNPSVWLRFPHLWQDEGVLFTDPITGTNFVGDGVSSAVVGGVLTVTIAGGSTPTPVDHTRYGALGADATFVAGDFTGGSGFNSDTNTLGVPAFATDQFLAFAIRNDIADPTDIREENSAFNSFSLFAKQTAQIMISTDMYSVWISNAALLPNNAAQNWVII